MEKYRKKWKMMEKGHILLKKAQIDEKLKNKNIFWISSCKYGKTKKKWKMMKKGHILLKKAQIDEKCGKKYIFWISSWKYGKI